MTSARAYRGARPSGDALRELWRCAGTEFHAEIVGALATALPGVTSESGDVVLERVHRTETPASRRWLRFFSRSRLASPARRAVSRRALRARKRRRSVTSSRGDNASNRAAHRHRHVAGSAPRRPLAGLRAAVVPAAAANPPNGPCRLGQGALPGGRALRAPRPIATASTPATSRRRSASGCSTRGRHRTRRSLPHLSYFMPMPASIRGCRASRPSRRPTRSAPQLRFRRIGWDARAAVVNSAPTRIFRWRPDQSAADARVRSRRGVTPITGLRLGVSFAHGAYATPDEISVSGAGRPRDDDGRRRRRVGVRLHEGRGEFIRTEFETRGGTAVAYEWFVQGHNADAALVRRRPTRRHVGATADQRHVVGTRTDFESFEATAGFRATRITLRSSYYTRRFYGATDWTNQIGSRRSGRAGGGDRVAAGMVIVFYISGHGLGTPRATSS